MKNKNKQIKGLEIFTYFCLALSLVSTITYMIYSILNTSNIMNQIISIISVIILAIFSICFIFIGLYSDSKKVKIFLIISSILLTIYSMLGLIISVNSNKDFVLDFTGYDIKEVVSWASERNILIEQEFENSDTVDKYKVISQNIKKGTSTKNLDKITVIVSDGIDTNISTIVDSMIGWNLDDVVSYIDENHLTNVNINFEFSNTVSKDKIISQDVISEIKRDDPITLVSSLGKESELKSVTLDNLVGLDTFHANIYCGRNNLTCTLEYSYSEDKDDGIILKQSLKKWTIINPNDKEELVLTVAKKNEISIPDFTKMNITKVNTWATNNRLKIEFSYEYDDTIKKDKIISSNYTKGNIVNVGDTIKVVISKGPIYMIKYTNLEDFVNWADENELSYDIDYQYSTSVSEGKLISSSHKENQIIKNEDTIKLVISEGSSTTIPNLIGLSKDEATNSCKEANINCKFIYLNDNTKYNIVTKQSMRSGSTVPADTTVTVTLGK